MKTLRKILSLKACNLLACMALTVATLSANGCAFIFHQDEIPNEVKKFRKF